MPDDSPIKKDNKEKEKEYIILKLKADVYELIKQQEMLTLQNNQIQELKVRKVQEINKLEAEITDANTK